MRVTGPVLSVVGFAATAGVAPPELLRAAGIDHALLSVPEIELSHPQELRLWAEAARLSGDEDFGLHLAEWVAPRSDEIFDVLAFALRSSATLGDAYRRSSRYFRLVHEGVQISLEEDAEVARLVHGHHQEPADPPRHPVEGLLALALIQGRRAIRDDFAPRAVRFTHARPARVSEHERIFRSPVHFGCPRTELVLDRAVLDRPQHSADPRLLAMLTRTLEERLSEQPERRRLVDAVRKCMMQELPDREPSIAAVAAKQHMSPRTLQRRLESEGTSFAKVLSELRRELALRFLRDPRIAIGEIGFLLGFRDVSAFHRAFRRWTGTTPAEYRRSAQSRGSQPQGAARPPVPRRTGIPSP